MSKPRVIQIIEDILCATIGVQNSETHKRQFEQASLSTYVIAGVLAIAAFVAMILLIVYVVI